MVDRRTEDGVWVGTETDRVDDHEGRVLNGIEFARAGGDDPARC